MIQANELRLGNLVNMYGGESTKPTKLDALGLVHIYEHELKPEVLGWVKTVNPIPLTVQILEAAGFVDVNYKEGKEFIHTGGRFSVEIKNGKFLVLSSIKQIFFSLCYVEHLHQLQNLFFALTGEELEINL